MRFAAASESVAQSFARRLLQIAEDFVQRGCVSERSSGFRLFVISDRGA
jgi:hypothetical protein